MSEEQQAQSDKNTKDIRYIKTTIPVVWALGLLFTFGTTLWAIATYSANKQNNEVNIQDKQFRATAALKDYFDYKLQQVRTKDSTDIASVNTNLVNLVSSTNIQLTGEIKLLREQCRRMTTESKLSRTLHYHFDNNGNRVVESVANK